MNRLDTIIPLGEQIITLAHECPYSGGDAVYRVRPYAELLNDTIEVDDYITCAQQGILRQINKVNEQSLSMIIKPNPAKNSFKIIFNKQCNDTYILKITDAVGKTWIIKESTCNNNENEINVSSIPSGYYQINVQVKSANYFNKLIIIR